MDGCSRDKHSDVSDMGECEQVGDFQNGIGGWRGEVGYIAVHNTLSSGKGGEAIIFSARLLFFPPLCGSEVRVGTQMWTG